MRDANTVLCFTCTSAACCAPRGTVYITDVHGPTLVNAAFNARCNFPAPGAADRIAADGSSNDRSRELMQEYEAKYCRVICHRSESADATAMTATQAATAADADRNDCTVKVAAMNWFDVTSFPPEQVDILIGSDLVYDQNILAALIPAVSALLSAGGCAASKRIRTSMVAKYNRIFF